MSPVKDRFADLQKIQIGGPQEPEDVSKTNDETLQKIFSKVENIRQDFDAMRGNTRRIEELLESYKLYPTKELQGQLHSMLSASSTVNFTISNKLKTFENETSKLTGDSASAESRIQKLHYASLKQEFQELLHENNEVIERYRDTFKSQLRATAKVVRNIDDEEELEKLLDESKPLQVFIDNILVDTNIAKQQLQDIEERHKELLFIESQLKDVNELFKQIAVLVEQQQESINRVEFHAQTATDCVEQGAVDLSKGVRKKRKTRKCKIYVGIALTVLIVLILLGLFIR